MSDNFIPIPNLPSQCLTYQDIKPGDILVRSYQGAEEELLSQLNPVNLERNYLQVLKRVVQGIDPSKLTLGDRLYIIVWECINSYTDVLKVKTVCSNCLRDIEISVDLKKLEVIKLPDDYKEPYEITLPVCGERVKLRLLTVEDEVEIEKYRQKHGNSHLYRYALSIVSDDNIVEKLKKLETMHGKDVTKIRTFHEKFYHGPDFTYKFTCPKCEQEDDVEVPFRFDFLFPNGETLTKTFGEEF